MRPRFPVHTTVTAPEPARALLVKARRKFGLVPNLIGEMAESPAVLAGYLAAADAFSQSSFSPVEQHVVLQTVNALNACDYCQASHSAAAIAALKIDPALDAALRRKTPLPDRRLDTLREFTSRVVTQRGWLDDADLRAFLDAGFSLAQVLEVMLGVGLKTISNYINHVAATPLDAPFAGHAVPAAA